MRTHSVITITSLCNAAAGALFVFAFWQGPLGVTLTLMGVAVVLALASIAWSILKFRKCISRLDNQATTLEAGRTGLAELGHIGLRFLRLVDETKHRSVRETSELAEVKRLLDKIDRREHDFDRGSEITGGIVSKPSTRAVDQKEDNNQTMYCFGDTNEVLAYTLGRFTWEKL